MNQLCIQHCTVADAVRWAELDADEEELLLLPGYEVASCGFTMNSMGEIYEKFSASHHRVSGTRSVLSFHRRFIDFIHFLCRSFPTTTQTASLCHTPAIQPIKYVLVSSLRVFFHILLPICRCVFRSKSARCNVTSSESQHISSTGAKYVSLHRNM